MPRDSGDQRNRQRGLRRPENLSLRTLGLANLASCQLLAQRVECLSLKPVRPPLASTLVAAP